MSHLISIFFGAAFTLFACWSAGKLFLARLRLDLFAGEWLLFRFAAGAALFSLLVLILAAMNLAREWVFLAAGAAVILPAFRIRKDALRLPDFSHGWKVLFAAIFVVFGVFYLVNALAPEASPDGATYHLGFVAKYLRQHGLGRITTSFYANLSEGLEMLFLVAFSIGRHSAATLIEFAYLLLLPFAMIAYGQRFGFPKAAVAAAVIVFCSPVFGISGSSAYNDTAAVFTLFCAFYALRIWEETRQPGLLILTGVLAGFCYGIKYTLAIAVLYCCGFVIWRLRRNAVKPVLILAACAAAMIAPWWIKNIVTVANPLSPFANRFFPNPYVTQRFEHDYVQLQSSGVSLADRPLEHTIGGGHTGGLLGAMFLLSPLALLALRYREGRMVLLAAAVFLLPSLANTQTRFLMLAAPFLALGISMAFMRTPGALLALTCIAAVFSWPSVVNQYCGPYAWRLQDFPIADALRTIPERESLTKRLPGYSSAELINARVPNTGRVFAASASVAEAYLTRDLVVGYESAYGETMEDILHAPLNAATQPTWELSFYFPRRQLRRLRVLQTADGGPEDDWSVAELRLFRPEGEVPREAGWKIRAQPNPWNVDLAFDNNPATRWRAREGLHARMQIEMDLGHPVDLDCVRLQCSHDQWAIRLRLEGEDAPGHWTLLSAAPTPRDRPLVGNIRRAATQEMKARGISHIFIDPAEYGAGDLQRNQDAWGIALVGAASGARLYVIR